jgi:hypothetical protein
VLVVLAQFGRVGANGRSSCAPTMGTDGRDISVSLSYSDAEGGLLVEGTKLWSGTRWIVPADQVLLLNCRGGDGGNGGNGEDGQQGGQGGRGRNATKHRDAEVRLPIPDQIYLEYIETNLFIERV